MDRNLPLVRTLGRIVLELSSRFFLPMAWAILVDLFKLLALTQINYFRNVPDTTRNTADEWVRKAADYGWPSGLEDTLHTVGRIVAFIILVVGWIINAYITVWLLGVIF